jgi:hypothetical protein
VANQGAYIAGLNEFRAALKATALTAPVELTKAIKVAGVPIVQESSQLSPRRTGALAGGYKTQVRGTVGNIVNRVPYAAGAEWGSHRKWSGFQKYGSPGSRFAGKAIDDKAEDTLLLIYESMRNIATIYGWAV